MTSPDTKQSDSGYRLLVIAADTVTGAQLRDAVADRAQDREIEVRLIAPALAGSKLGHVMGDVDEARAVAAERLERSTEELERAGLKVDGAIGDGDLKLAIQDALQTFPADEIVIVAHRDGGDVFETQWIEGAEREFEPAITEIYVDHPDRGEAVVADIEKLPAGQDRADPEEEEPESRNLPPFSPRDLLGIAVAIVGTIVLVILAASGNDNLNDGDNAFSSQSARILIAGAMALLNLAHVIGLVLFQSGPYRGFGRDLFARLSLFGTPTAIIACLLLT